MEQYRLNHNQKSFETIFQKHLEVFNTDLLYVTNETKLNNILNEKLDHLKCLESEKNELSNIEYKKPKRIDSIQYFIEDFNHSLKLLNEVRQNIIEANKFYNDLISSTNSFFNEIQDFENERKLQKKLLNDKLLGDKQ